jgi:hypothetical protein
VQTEEPYGERPLIVGVVVDDSNRERAGDREARLPGKRKLLDREELRGRERHATACGFSTTFRHAA